MQNMINRGGKITLTFNSDKYKDLLVQYEPKIIRTEEENERALAVVEELMHRESRTVEEEELYQLLIFLIEKFEHDYYHPGKDSSPHSILLFLIEQRGITKADLIGIIGTKEVVAKMIEGKSEISTTQAQALGEFFKVDLELFIAQTQL